MNRDVSTSAASLASEPLDHTKRSKLPQPLQRVVFIMIDGLADVSIPDLGFLTPLQYAKTPFMDALAKSGLNGLEDPVEPGLACGSDTAHLSILGYPPRQYYRGRGAFESMGAGLDMIPGDIAFKSNFATLDPKTNVVLRRRADRNFEEWGPPLCDFLTGSELPSFPGYRVDVKYATEHRCGVRVRGPGLTDTIRDTDPLKDNLLLQTAVALEDTEESRRTAQLVNELSAVFHHRLASHPLNVARESKGLPSANLVLLRGCGSRIHVQPFEERHGLKPFMIAPTCIIAGLAMSLSMDIVVAPGGTGDYRTNLASKAQTLTKTITAGSYTFGFLHLKAVDDAGHDRNTRLKVDFLERIDREVLGHVVPALAEAGRAQNVQYFVVLTGDHSTPVQYGDHSCEPVPFVIAEASAAAAAHSTSSPVSPASSLVDSVQAFSEIDAARGALGRFTGSEVMGTIKNYLHAHS